MFKQNNIEQTKQNKNQSRVHSCNTSNKIRTVFHTKLNLERKNDPQSPPVDTQTRTNFPIQERDASDGDTTLLDLTPPPPPLPFYSNSLAVKKRKQKKTHSEQKRLLKQNNKHTHT